MPKEKETLVVNGVEFDGEDILIDINNVLPLYPAGMGITTDDDCEYPGLAMVPWEILEAAVEKAKSEGWLKPSPNAAPSHQDLNEKIRTLQNERSGIEMCLNLPSDSTLQDIAKAISKLYKQVEWQKSL